MPILRVSKLCHYNPNSTSIAISVRRTLDPLSGGISRGVSLGADMSLRNQPCLHGKPSSSRAEIPVGWISRIRPIEVPNTEEKHLLLFFS